MRTISLISLVFFLFFLFLGKASGETASTELNIRANVPPLVEHKVLHERRLLRISRVSILRGEKWVVAGTIVGVKSNSQDGYLLSVQSLSTELYTSVTVQIMGEGQLFEIPSGGSIGIHIPHSALERDIVVLNYIFHLSDEAKKGKYPWPIRVDANPI